ncbi:D-alanyl-D-alanine carboxypeptidase [Streptomyces sp. NBC_00059]|uniref:D-alanyl-D-alanine carboxypeptidase n=1 Tax=Streptomyces sp. NBC_00059 TaxID=2975635 RepID=UPI002257B648|nr:D-alanyl-D-alanine carboxypeptidase [Streptomyces sp. NBC_00059]MCX5411928.1 D-alanyl-D-alanine carboxypeptidase [Streptomyces sp. NBC_00059]
MAGESPDRSEQRKSSGTASGTAEERDPRLAVLREPVASAGGSTAGGTTDAAKDDRTAVFRLPRSEELGAPEGAQGAQEGAEGAEKASEGPGKAPEADEAEGVPATADTAPVDAVDVTAEAGDGGEAGSRPDAGAEADAEPQAASDADADAEPDAGADADAPESDASRSDAPESGASQSDASRSDAPESGASQSDAPESDAEPDEQPEAGAAPGSPSGSEPTDSRLRAAVAAWVATGDDDEEAGRGGKDSGSKAAEGDGKAAGAAVDAPSDAESEEPADDAAADDAAADDAAADEVPADQGDAPAGTTPAGSGSTPADAPRIPKTREESSAPDEAAEDDKADETAEETAETGKSDAADKRDVAAKGDTSDKSDAAAKADKPSVDDKADAPAERDGAEVSDDAEPKGDQRGIDHPTTVFKALRPQQVDQPTTALKIPPRESAPKDSAPKEGAPKDSTPKEGAPKEGTRKPAWAATRSSDAPEAPAERTSKFVPLRSDDVRPPVVGPTVTPDVSAAPGTPGAPGAGLTEAERTRQQPMPPRPPLDLLAELTNTPPPPETPVRTAVRRVKIWTPLLLLVVIIFAIAQAVRPLPEPTLTLSASPTYTFGGEKLDMPWPEEGQGAVEVEGVGTIGSYGAQKAAPIASVAKIMTAYVILQGHPITGKENGDQIVVDAKAGEEANRPDESTASIKEGQKYTERQMLQLLMIPSGNNVARLLARWDATTEKAFVEKMNAAAKDLGMTDSVYTDPSGLESTTRSTPADQLKLAKAVMQNDVFREIVNMPQAEIPGIGKTIYNNNNILLQPGVSGIKTGSSTPAGGNLVWTAETVIDGKTRRIIGAVMGADVDGTLDAKLQRALQSSLTLIQAAQKGVDSATVVKKGQVVGYVDNGFGTRTPVVATKDLKAVGWGGLQVELELGAGDEPLQQTAKAGTVVGQVTVGTGTGKVSTPVALQSGMTEPGFGDKFTRIT